MPHMKTVLCFGDSNTWGFIPGTNRKRMPYPQRIPSLIQAQVGPQYRILDEALNGRMTAWDDPMNPDKNAARQLPFLLDSHRPLDLVSVMLGTNDMKLYMHLTAQDSAIGQETLIDGIEAAHCGPEGGRPKILIIAPPPLVETPTPFGHLFDGGLAKSLGFAAAYRDVAAKRNCLFLDAGSVAQASSRDGIHLEAGEHAKIAQAMAEIILRELS